MSAPARCSQLLIALLAGALAIGCSRVTPRAADAPVQYAFDGVLNGYISPDGFRTWDGSLFKLHFAPDAPQNEDVATVGVKYLAEVGIGMFGLRVHTLIPAFGVGAIGYHPQLADIPVAGQPPAVPAIDDLQQQLAAASQKPAAQPPSWWQRLKNFLGPRYVHLGEDGQSLAAAAQDGFKRAGVRAAGTNFLE